MSIFHPLSDDDMSGETGVLETYRLTVDQLHRETAVEFGGQPMPPEAFSMIAILVASLPLMALLHPAVPVELRGWEVGLTLASVWSAAFFLQRLRYDRFHARVARKVARVTDGTRHR